jgi:hypothetical protein
VSALQPGAAKAAMSRIGGIYVPRAARQRWFKSKEMLRGSCRNRQGGKRISSGRDRNYPMRMSVSALPNVSPAGVQYAFVA